MILPIYCHLVLAVIFYLSLVKKPCCQWLCDPLINLKRTSKLISDLPRWLLGDNIVVFKAILFRLLEISLNSLLIAYKPKNYPNYRIMFQIIWNLYHISFNDRFSVMVIFVINLSKCVRLAVLIMFYMEK